jgi:hypothetical protein
MWLVVVGTLALDVTSSSAQTVSAGTISGYVLDKATGEPLIGATIVVTSPALQGTHAEITGDQGHYRIGGLPVGTYTVTAYYADATVRRVHVRVESSGTGFASFAIDTSNQWTGCVFSCGPSWAQLADGEWTIGTTRRQSESDILPTFGARSRLQPTIVGHRLLGGAAIPRRAIDEHTTTRFGTAAVDAPASRLLDVTLIGGSNELHGDVGIRGAGGSVTASAQMRGPIEKDHGWLALASEQRIERDVLRSRAIGQGNYALSPEHQLGVVAGLGVTTARTTVDKAAKRGARDAGFAVASWLSRFDNNKTEVRASSSWSGTAVDALAERSERLSARGDITKRFRAGGAHQARLSVGTERTRHWQPGDRDTIDNHWLAVEDSWQWVPQLNLYAGTRIEQSDGAKQSLPRVGFSWDPFREAGTRVFGHVGRYRSADTPRDQTRMATLGVEHMLLERELSVGSALLMHGGQPGAWARARYGSRLLRTRVEYTWLPAARSRSDHRIEIDAMLAPVFCLQDAAIGVALAAGGAADQRQGVGVRAGYALELSHDTDLHMFVEAARDEGNRRVEGGARIEF